MNKLRLAVDSIMAAAFAAAKDKDWACLVALVKKNPQFAKKKDTDGCTLLHLACANSAPAEVISLLIAANPDAAKEKISDDRQLQFLEDGWLPLHLACANNASFEVVSSLLAAHPDGAKAKYKDGRLPLHLACSKDASIDVIRALLAAHPDGEAAQLPGCFVCDGWCVLLAFSLLALLRLFDMFAQVQSQRTKMAASLCISHAQTWLRLASFERCFRLTLMLQKKRITTVIFLFTTLHTRLLKSPEAPLTMLKTAG